MNRFLFCLCMVVALVACSGSEQDGEQVAQAGSSFEDSSPGLRGTDTDANGIRDDVDHLISSNYSATPGLRRAAQQQARALQSMLEATTREQALAASDQINRATECIYQREPGVENQQLRITLVQELEALTANTRQRLFKYLDANKLAAGGYLMQPVEPVCD